MAPEPAGPQRKVVVVVESYFLFGLRKSDARHSRVITALRMHRAGELEISLLSSDVLEVRAALRSRGLRSEDIEESFALMAAIFAEYSVDETLPVDLADFVVAERLLRTTAA